MTLPQYCATHSLKEFMELIELDHNDPTRKNKMEDIINVPAGEASLALTDVKHYVINEDGSRTEGTPEVLGEVQAGEGPVATEHVAL